MIRKLRNETRWRLWWPQICFQKRCPEGNGQSIDPRQLVKILHNCKYYKAYSLQSRWQRGHRHSQAVGKISVHNVRSKSQSVTRPQIPNFLNHEGRSVPRPGLVSNDSWLTLKHLTYSSLSTCIYIAISTRSLQTHSPIPHSPTYTSTPSLLIGVSGTCCLVVQLNRKLTLQAVRKHPKCI